MDNKRWVKIKKSDGDIDLSEIPGLHFLEWTIPSVSTSANELEMSGVDGVLVGENTFDPFDLELKFYFDGTDAKDLNLFSQRLKGIVNQRKPYYVVHSDMPCFKYACNTVQLEYEKITVADMTFSLTFRCYKGYAESLYSTKNYNKKSGYFQFENGLLATDSISYSHNVSEFNIYNGGNDRIDPHMHHKLKISINADAPNGFKLTNSTNETVFEYKKAIKKNKTLVLDGIYASIDKKRVGADTNHGIIILEENLNHFEIEGQELGEVKVSFDFNFLYR